MIKLKNLGLMILFCLILVSTSFAQVKEISIKDLKDSPKTFLGQTVTIVGTIQIAPGKSLYDGEFIVLDQEGQSFQISPWVPMDIAPSPPGTPTQGSIHVMGEYIGKLLKLEGKIRLDEGRSQMKKKEHYFMHVQTAIEIN